MTPTSIRMNSQVSQILSGSPELGSTLGPTLQGWSNIYSQYLLGGPQTAGKPLMHSPRVHSWVGLSPRWSQPPRKLYSSPYGAIMYPVQDSPTPPPINGLTI